MTLCVISFLVYILHMLSLQRRITCCASILFAETTFKCRNIVRQFLYLLNHSLRFPHFWKQVITIKSALFVENALSDSSFSQHDNHAANADFKDRRRRENQRANRHLNYERNYVFSLLKPFKKENLSNLFTFSIYFKIAMKIALLCIA